MMAHKIFKAFVCCIFFASVAHADDWTEFQGNSQHTGFQPVTINFTKINLSWHQYQFPDAQGGGKSHPLVVNGIVYLTMGMTPHWPQVSSGDQVVAVDPSNGGKILWHTSAGWCNLTTLTASGNIIYGAGEDNCNFLFLINISSGELLKKIDVTASVNSHDLSISSGDMNNIFMRSRSTIYSYNQDGASPLAYELTPYFYENTDYHNNPLHALTNKYLIFYNDSENSKSGALSVYDRKTGKLNFIITNPRKAVLTGYVSNITPIILDENHAAALDGHGNLVVYNLEEQKISYTLSGYFGHIIADDKFIYAEKIIDGCPVVAMDKNTGVISWSYGYLNEGLVARECMTGEMIVTNNILIAAGVDTTFVISKDTHTLLGSINGVGHMALANNKLYILGNTWINGPALSEYSF